MARTRSFPKSQKKLGGAKTPDGHRVTKVEAVAYLTEKLRSSTAVFLTEYRGLTVHELAELRVALSKQDAEYKVAKNTLARIAVKEAGFAELTAMLQGPVAIAFAAGDAVLTAKELTEFAKKAPALVLKGALMEGQVFDEAGAKRIASLESREVMLSKAAGMFITPIQQTVNVFAATLNNFGAVLASYKDKLAASGDAA
ncbi:MAG TPA: 50S ribosomal protein L10 [Steroidobacteraceae bacterium]